MGFADALMLARSAPDDPDVLDDLARAAVAEGHEAAALTLIEPAARRSGRALLWQWTGLLHRALDHHADALVALTQAARAMPNDAGIAHGRAQTALEAGLPAVGLFETAQRLDQSSGEILTGLAAARLAAGKGEAAIDHLAAVLDANPGWIEGHRTIAQLRTLLFGKAAADASFDRATTMAPAHFPIWQAWIAMLLDGERHDEALDVTARARRRFGAAPHLTLHEAIALSERGHVEAAEPLFEALPVDAATAIWHVRHFLRTGRPHRAMPLIEERLDPADPAMWPYAAIAWRLNGDPRYEWLERAPRLVSVVDLTGDLPPLARLADVLRGLHVARGEHLDQSVRGGTQTDGPLLSRLEPEIVALRTAIVAAVERHISQLPPPDPHHATLAKRRDRTPRFSGSWSVRLGADGHHANHVHPRGWLSSALYIALPDGLEKSGSDAGWLTLGQPQAALGLDLPPFLTIEPRPGRLVLFPSTMWHGTVPFATGERLTVAFDVAPPI